MDKRIVDQHQPVLRRVVIGDGHDPAALVNPSGKVELIRALAARGPVTRPRDDRVIPGIAVQVILPLGHRVQRVFLRTAVDIVVAIPTHQRVGPRAAVKRVIAKPAHQRVVASPAIKEIGLGPAVQPVGAVTPAQHIPAQTASQAVIPGLARKEIVAIATVKRIVPLAAQKRIRPVIAKKLVVARAADKRIRPGIAVDLIVAAKRVDPVIRRHATRITRKDIGHLGRGGRVP